MSTYANFRQIPHLIAKRQPFEGNTMRATNPMGRDSDGEHILHMGQLYLHPEDQDKFRGRVFEYLIFSYQTPIAGITTDNEAILVEGKFSQTTTRHQGAANHGFIIGGLR